MNFVVRRFPVRVRGARRRHVLCGAFALAVVLLSGAGCGDLASRGSPAWQRACTAHADKGCPCHKDSQCDTLWCVNGECAYRESL
ncbi:MAG TPA: hypothetical protein VGG39_13935 [Polyangiaceae bacterium]|jgi:hypothetical protein